MDIIKVNAGRTAGSLVIGKVLVGAAGAVISVPGADGERSQLRLRGLFDGAGSCEGV